MSNEIFIFAGEVSGDLHGAHLMESLYQLNPDVKIVGVGGPRMRAKGLECLIPMENFQVMGFIDIIFAFPRLFRLFKKVKNLILKRCPQSVIFIDYPGFNLRMARAIKKSKSTSKLIHYICPSVWAWGKKRIPLMEKNLDLLLTILPFEKKYFNQGKLETHYVGNPLITQKRPPTSGKYLSIFPGSRFKEIKRNFPLQLEVALKMREKCPHLKCAISCVKKEFLPLIKKHLNGEDIPIFSSSETLMQKTKMAIATSGTVTLELALHQIPTVVTYAITKLDLFLAQKIFRINLPYYSLPNIIADREVFKELFGPYLTKDNLTSAVASLRDQEHIKKGCAEIKNLLGDKNASHEAANLILK